jgi:5'-deoxynucleotidase YfbR-like HD superfamily hydrolase
MSKLKAIFAAGRVRRWHTNADLSLTSDYIDGHSGRVARICLALWPQEFELACHALIHDDGESATADLPSPLKRSMPADVADWLVRVEAQAMADIWGEAYPKATGENFNRLKFADRLDAYQWAIHHKPELADRDDWLTAKVRLFVQAEALGVVVEFMEARL